MLCTISCQRQIQVQIWIVLHTMVGYTISILCQTESYIREGTKRQHMRWQQRRLHIFQKIFALKTAKIHIIIVQKPRNYPFLLLVWGIKKLKGIFNFCISIIKLSLGSQIFQRVSRKKQTKRACWEARGFGRHDRRTHQYIKTGSAKYRPGLKSWSVQVGTVFVYFNTDWGPYFIQSLLRICKQSVPNSGYWNVHANFHKQIDKSEFIDRTEQVIWEKYIFTYEMFIYYGWSGV